MAEVLTPFDEQGRRLSPLEAKTGVVLPIWAPGDGRTNLHHRHFRKRDHLNGPRKMETRSVRFSGLQRVQASAHDRYHDWVHGTGFPEDEKQSFGITIFNSARYIPSHVVEMSGSRPTIIETTPRMRRALLVPGVLTMERRRSYRREIGQFLMYHAVAQNFDHVRQDKVEEFIELGQPQYARDELAQQRRYKIGMRLANIGLGLAVDGIDKKYHQARQEQALPDEAPVCAWQVAKDYVHGYEPDYFETLEENLITQFGIPA